jgi:DNA end-binding protein Ku
VRSIWNGAISFGLVSIPIKLMNATENHSISFRQIHKEDGGRIRYRKVCELDEEEVTTADIGKAYEDADGSIIPITDEDLDALPLPTAKTIEIVAFVPSGDIDPLQMDSAYYLSANGVPAVKPYTLLREALKRSEKVAVAKFALRGRERLGMLRVVDDVIAMHGLLWPDEIRTPEGVAPEADVAVRDAELDLADALMNTLGEIDLSTLHDGYRNAVEELVAAKAQGEPAPKPAASEGGGKVIDLMAALENSVEAAKEARGGNGESAAEDTEEADDAEVTHLKDRKQPPRRTGTGGSAKKTAARKQTPAAKTGAAKTAAAKKTAEPKKTTQRKKSAQSKTTQSNTARSKTTQSKKAAQKKPQSKRASA